MAARMTRLATALVAAIMVTGVLGIVVQTQFVLAGLRGLGAHIGLAETLRFSMADLAGMASTYATALAPTFAIAFAVAAWLQPRTRVPRALAFAIAGGSGIVVLLTGDWMLEGHHWIAGSRGWDGMACQGLAGAAGGLLFARLTRPKVGQAKVGQAKAGQAGRATPM